MKCPDDVSLELAEILKWGLLRIRTSGYQGDGRRCVQESDHIHNLPGLLVDYAPQLLAFYWNTERPLLIKQLGIAECKPFDDIWSRLKPLVERECAGMDLALPVKTSKSEHEAAAIS
jgi:hypothetical protein